MSTAPTSAFLWPVARVLGGYWLRRHRTPLLLIGAAGFLALVLVLSGQSQRAEAFFGQILLLSPIAAGLLTTGGIVSDERESGLTVMWFQKKGSLFRTYFVRYAVGQAILFALCTFFALCAATTGVAAGVIPLARGVRIVCVLWIFAVLPAAMVFALSTWGVKRDAVLALIIMVASLSMAAATALEQNASFRVLRVAAFPLEYIAVLIGSGRSASFATAVLVVLGHGVAWTAAAVLGLRYTSYALARGK